MTENNFHLYRPGDSPGELGPAPTDAETVAVEPVRLGASADAPDFAPALTWADLTATGVKRMPIIPAWMQSWAQLRATGRAIGSNLAYIAAFHAWRSPKYAGKVVVYAPRGLLRLVSRLLVWASAEQHNWDLRQHAANTNDAYTWQALNRTRSRESRARWWALGLGTILPERLRLGPPSGGRRVAYWLP